MSLLVLDDVSEPAACSEAASHVPHVRCEMTRRHFSKLRHFWACRSRAAASLCDGIELDLVGMGYIRRLDKGLSGYVTFAITEAGEFALAAERQNEIARRKPHHDLGSRTAAWLRDQGRITWEDVEFRIREVDTSSIAHALGIEPVSRFTAAVRPDVYSMATTLNADNINPAVHEVKVSRADYLADIARPEKRLAYACIAEVLYFVCPAGVIDATDLPPGVGLVVETSPEKFEVVRRPKRRKVSLGPSHFMNLVLKPGTFTPL
jgi:hypothetical protein